MEGAMSVYQLNKLLYNLKNAEKIQALVVNEKDLASQYKLSPEEIEALKAEDIDRLYHLGANPLLIRLNYRKKFRY
jgi:hypothetical protein